jgi:hypothetical protein
MPRPVILTMSVTTISRRSVELMCQKPAYFISQGELTPGLPGFGHVESAALAKGTVYAVPSGRYRL